MNHFPKPNQLWIDPNQRRILPDPVQITYPKPLSLGEAFKPVPAGILQSHIYVILDDSGSMWMTREKTRSAVNEFLEGQKRDARESGIPTYISLFKFGGSGVVCLYKRANVLGLEEFTDYDPRQSSTNLHDAIGAVMTDLNNEQGAVFESRRDSIIVTVITDGEENSSRTFTGADVKAMVSKAQDARWGFQFLGANIDAFSVGGTLGFSQQTTMQYGAGNIESAMRGATRSVSSMKSAYARGESTESAYNFASFTAEERGAAVGEDSDGN